MALGAPQGQRALYENPAPLRSGAWLSKSDSAATSNSCAGSGRGRASHWLGRDYLSLRRPARSAVVGRPVAPVRQRGGPRVDGGVGRRSHGKKNGVGALHSVRIWAREFGLSLGQVACAAKSNEIAAIPEVLKLVDSEGAIVAIDAMGTPRAIAAQIATQDAD